MKMTSHTEIESNLSLDLFECALSFDKKRTVNSIKKSGKEYLKNRKIKTHLLKGYSHISKLPMKALENKFRSILISNTNYMLPFSFLDEFYLPCLLRFDEIYSSDLILETEDKIRKGIFYSSIQTGWSVDIINNLLQYYGLVLDKFLDDTIISALDTIDELTEFENVMRKEITGDIIQTWRMNFPFRPDSIFSPIIPYREKNASKIWDKIQGAINEKNQNLFLEITLEILDSETDNNVLLHGLINQILIGIDLKKPDVVLKALEKIEKILNEISSSKFPLFTIRTTSSLGYAFLGRYNEAFESLAKLNNPKYFNSFVLGLAGSILLKNDKINDGTKLFALAFKLRKSPLSWPILAISKVQENLNTIIKDILNDNEIPSYVNAEKGSKIIKVLENAFPDCVDSTKFLKNIVEKYISKRKHPKKKLVKIKVDKEIDEKYAASLSLKNIATDLNTIFEFYKKIILFEEEFENAQKERKWSDIQRIASDLESFWERTRSELQNLISSTSLPNDFLKKSELQGLLDHEKNPSDLKKVLYELNIHFKEKHEKRQAQIEKDKKVFLTRLKNAGLNNLWSKKKITISEFDKLKDKLLPKILRSETLTDIEKDKMNIVTFENRYTLEKDRIEIIETIFNKIDKKLVQINYSIADIITTVSWPKDRAAYILNHYVAGLKEKFPGSIIEEFQFIKYVIPFLIKLSDAIGIPVVASIIKQEIFVESFINLLNNADYKEETEKVKIAPKRGKPLVQDLINFSNTKESQISASKIILSWIEFDSELDSEDRIEMLSLWLYSTQKYSSDKAFILQIDCIRKLRDELINQSKFVEAALFLSSCWKTYRDPNIFDGFESQFYLIMVQLAKETSPSKNIIYTLLQNPDWIFINRYGVILFLYLCHLADFGDLFDQAKYQYYSKIEEFRKNYPVLVDEYFINYRFGDESAESFEPDENKSDIATVFKDMENFEIALKRKSSYNPWPPALAYQKTFNEKIINLKEKIFTTNYKSVDKIEKYINSIEPLDWIEEADKQSGKKVRSPATETMVKYIDEQILALKKLNGIKRKYRIDNLHSYLKAESQPFHVRLQRELEQLEDKSDIITLIYEDILEALNET